MSIKISSKSILVAAFILAAPLLSAVSNSDRQLIKTSHKVLKAIRSKSNKAKKYMVNVGGRQFGPMGYDDALKFQAFATNDNVPVRLF